MASIQERIYVISPITQEIYNQFTDKQKKKCKFENGKIFYKDYLPKKFLNKLPRSSRKMIKYIVIWREDGKQKASKPFSNKKIAILFKKEKESELDSARLKSYIKNVEVGEGVQKYIEYLKHEGRSPATLKRVGQILGKLVRFCSEKEIKYLKDIKIDDMEEYKTWNRNMKPSVAAQNIPVSPRTLADEFTRFRSFYRYANRLNWMVDNPFKPLSKTHKSYQDLIYNPYTEKEFEQIISETKNDFWRRIWYFLYFTGVRTKELQYLQIKDVDFDNNLIHIRNKPELGFFIKNYQERSIPIHKEKLLGILQEIIEEKNMSKTSKDEFLFATKNKTIIQSKHIYDRLKSILKKLKLDRPRCVYQFRHSFGTRLAQLGASEIQIARLMGHKDTATTRIYIHLTGRDQQEIIDLL